MLFDPGRHELLTERSWSADEANAAIGAIARDAIARFSPAALWPPHPLDTEDAGATQPYTMLYVGATGVIWALDWLARAGAISALPDFAPLMDELAARNRAQVGPWGSESLLMGRSGVLLTHYRLAPSMMIGDRLAASIAANTNHPARELMWGAPGTMHAALAMHEITGEPRWAELFRAGAQSLAASCERLPGTDCHLWTQDLHGQKQSFIGAAHGFAGNASALIRGRALLPVDEVEQWADRILQTLDATARRNRCFANWPAVLPRPGTTRPQFLLQWCHGAPGIVTSLADFPDGRIDPLLVAAGELIWHAGPLIKGSGLCHGTAGNGMAFLKLFRRTGDELWLARARGFAMHAIAQSEDHAREYGMRRYSLMTGDAGLAIYLWNCLHGTACFPILDRDAPPHARQ
jgi:hypothetical protein